MIQIRKRKLQAPRMNLKQENQVSLLII